MCGIAGFIQSGGFLSGEAENIVELMSRQLVHRGPDGHGVWVDEQAGIALGHRRLSIIDLSAAGHQPMLSSCGRWMVSFNGEIYNHNDIRDQLQKQGNAPKWRGHSDTETVLAAVTAWGVEDAINVMIGMFAFAFWDRQKNELFLVRDRMGEKPLYYGWQGDTFLFGSELKALACHPSFKGEIDPVAMGRYFAHNYIPAPHSIYRGIFKLPPASWLKISAKDVARKVSPDPQKYWSLSQVAQITAPDKFSTIDDAADSLEELLRTVLDDQMLADVPLGAFLSGGIDSSLIVALMQSKAGLPVKSFAIGMPDAGLDESGYAAAVAEHLGTDHLGHTISSEEALAMVPELPEIWDEPFADSSQIPTLLVSHLTRQHVTVALSGDGADELFLGYNHYREMQNIWHGRFLSNFPLETGAACLRSMKLPGTARLTPRVTANLTTLLSARSKNDLITRYLNRYRNEAMPMNHIMASDFVEDDFYYGDAESIDPALLIALRDQNMYLPDNIMVKVDRASMNASLETRAPFLDHRVVEFAWQLPLKYKLKGKESKRILRRLLYRYVPQQLVERPKQGFSIPVAKWLRSDLREWGDSLLLSSDLEACGLNSKQVLQYWSEHQQKGIDHSGRLWGILMLRAFMQQRAGL